MRFSDISHEDLRRYYRDSVATLHLKDGTSVTGTIVEYSGEEGFSVNNKFIRLAQVVDLTLPKLGYFVWKDCLMYAVRTPAREVSKGLSTRNVIIDVAKGWEILSYKKRSPVNVLQAVTACMERRFPVQGKSFVITSPETLEIISPSGKTFNYVKEIHVPDVNSPEEKQGRQQRRYHKT